MTVTQRVRRPRRSTNRVSASSDCDQAWMDSVWSSATSDAFVGSATSCWRGRGQRQPARFAPGRAGRLLVCPVRMVHVVEKTVQHPNRSDNRRDGQQGRAGPANPVEPPWLPLDVFRVERFRVERFRLDSVVVYRPREIGGLLGQRGGAHKKGVRRFGTADGVLVSWVRLLVQPCPFLWAFGQVAIGVHRNQTCSV